MMMWLMTSDDDDDGGDAHGDEDSLNFSRGDDYTISVINIKWTEY
jgi:hypothetical protein